MLKSNYNKNINNYIKLINERLSNIKVSNLKQDFKLSPKLSKSTKTKENKKKLKSSKSKTLSHKTKKLSKDKKLHHNKHTRRQKLFDNINRYLLK